MPLFTLHFHNRETPDSSAEPTSKILDNTQFRCDFHLQEWTSLRAEITSQIDHTRKLELATVAGLGAFYGWFFVTKAEHSNLTNFLLVIPCLLVLLAGLRAWGLMAYGDGFPPDGSALMSLRSPLPLRASSGFSPDSLLSMMRQSGGIIGRAVLDV